MLENPFLWSGVLGVAAYLWLAFGGAEASRPTDPREMLALAAWGAGIALFLLFLSACLAGLFYGVTVWQFFSADIPGWQFRKTVYVGYSVLTSASLCAIHAGIWSLLRRIGRRDH